MSLLSRIRSLFRPALSCRDANAFIAAYLDDALDESTRTSFLAHVARCPVCERFLRQYESTIEICRTDARSEVPPELIENTLRFLRSRGMGDA